MLSEGGRWVRVTDLILRFALRRLLSEMLNCCEKWDDYKLVVVVVVG